MLPRLSSNTCLRLSQRVRRLRRLPVEAAPRRTSCRDFHLEYTRTRSPALYKFNINAFHDMYLELITWRFHLPLERLQRLSFQMKSGISVKESFKRGNYFLACLIKTI
jgi:hypothetical protein